MGGSSLVHIAHGCQHADAGDPADRDITPLDILLDDRTFGIASKDAPDRGRDAFTRRGHVQALARPLEVRLHDHRQIERSAAAWHGHERISRDGDPRGSHDALRERLVEAEREHTRRAPGAWQAELLEQRRVERLAKPAPVAFREVEHELGRDCAQLDDDLVDRARDLDRANCMA